MLVAPGKGGARIVALNRAAQQGGLADGELLSNARSKVLDLQIARCRSGRRCRRPAQAGAVVPALYAPRRAWDEASGADGLFLDITGCAHLFGGEERLLADLSARLRAFGLVPRLAVAGTAGRRLGGCPPWRADASDRAARRGGEALCSPCRSPRCASAESTPSLLRRLGLRRIGELIDQPRAPFAARFEAELLRRLDQALGHAPEPLVPVVAAARLSRAGRLPRADLQPGARAGGGNAPARAPRRAIWRAMPSARACCACCCSESIRRWPCSLDLGLAAPSRDARAYRRA